LKDFDDHKIENIIMEESNEDHKANVIEGNQKATRKDSNSNK